MKVIGLSNGTLKTQKSPVATCMLGLWKKKKRFNSVNVQVIPQILYNSQHNKIYGTGTYVSHIKQNISFRISLYFTAYYCENLANFENPFNQFCEELL